MQILNYVLLPSNQLEFIESKWRGEECARMLRIRIYLFFPLLHAKCEKRRYFPKKMKKSDCSK